MTKELELMRKLGKHHDSLVAKGVVIPDAYKRRDPKEPGREEKELAELKLEKLVKRLFAFQKKKIKEWLELQYYARKQAPAIPDALLDNAELEASLILKLTGFVIEGFEMVTEGLNISSNIDHALDFIRGYAHEFIDGIKDYTLKGLRKALELFVDTPGMSVGDVMDLLSKYFDESRVQRIAITEITRAYGAGAQLAGEELAREFPGVRVIKTWFTNNDGLVCNRCRPLNGVSVKLKSKFVDGEGIKILHPPSHVNCRCWMSVRTDITKSVELQK